MSKVEENINAEAHVTTGTPVEAASAEKTTHEITLSAEPIFAVGGFQVTNSLLNTWLVVFILIAFTIVLRLRVKKIPRGIQNVFEMVLEGGLNLCDSVTHDRKKTMKIFPVVFTLFVFILLNNWMGILPGIGTIGFIESNGAHSLFVPFFRGGTADLNTTLALAIMVVVLSNVFGLATVGIWKYFNKFINFKALAQIPKKMFKDPSVLIVNPIKFFVGLIEIIGEIAKVASLSFRLFGNVFAGEVLLASIAVIFSFGLPIPFMFLEIIVGIIQALIFAMLTLVYFTIAVTDEEH
jgi:F-type H+-transporting ATPase subunit a